MLNAGHEEESNKRKILLILDGMSVQSKINKNICIYIKKISCSVPAKPEFADFYFSSAVYSVNYLYFFFIPFHL
jgi:hypothetical protein